MCCIEFAVECVKLSGTFKKMMGFVIPIHNQNHEKTDAKIYWCTVEFVQSDTLVFRHSVTSDKNLWSQSISVN